MMISPRLVVLAGNPNVGKTTLFNALTGSSAKVSNYPGVTVERRVAPLTLASGPVAVLDLPGTYSLVARSAEEQIALDTVAGLSGPAPDVIVVCIDATQPSRSAYFLLQCQELGARCVVALTMGDEAGIEAPRAPALATAFGCEVVAINATRGEGLTELKAAIDRSLALPAAPVWRWHPSAPLRARLDHVRAALPDGWPRTDAVALWAMQSIDDDDELVGIPAPLRAAIGNAHDMTHDDEPVLARWAWLDTHLAHAHAAPVPAKRKRTELIDRWLLHRAWGFVAFVGVMFLVFMSLFTWADPLIDGVDHGFKWVGHELAGLLGENTFSHFIVDGIVAGVGSVVVFLPQILLLFLFIGFLEDCGYLARVAYLMDRVMRLMNLHGRAFIPMLSGFACAVPAVMATRTMERRRDRILTMMVVPLMTCSARLPVYTIIIAALIPASRAVQGMMMVGMYAFSVVTSLVAAFVLSRLKPLRAKRLPFFIELPPYRWPKLRDVIRQMWDRGSMFLREAGTVILACSIALWALLYFPRTLAAGTPDYAAQIATAEAAHDDDRATALENELAQVRIENSYGGRLGHAIEPALAPLGFDWKIGIGIIGAFAAREVFVSTMGIVYRVGGDADAESVPLRQALRDEHTESGQPKYTPLVGLSLMIFFALACQCMSTLAVVKRETGGYRWPLLLFGYMTVLAWIVSFGVYQGGRLLGFS